MASIDQSVDWFMSNQIVLIEFILLDPTTTKDGQNHRDFETFHVNVFNRDYDTALQTSNNIRSNFESLTSSIVYDLSFENRQYIKDDTLGIHRFILEFKIS